MRASFGAAGELIDVAPTTARLIDRVRAGELELLRADCPLERTVELFEAERRYTLRHYLRCRVCGRTVLYGLAARGFPIYRHVPGDEPVTVRWEPSDTFVDTLGGPVLRF